MARSDILTMESILVINAKAKDVAGFPVRRALPAIERRMIGPFVFLDQMGPTQLAPGQRLDVRPHPHIGLSTMTYLFEGEILHRDSLGTVQTIQPGAINWMTAGRGIAHSECTPEETRRLMRPIRHPVLGRVAEDPRGDGASFFHLEANVLPVLAGPERLGADHRGRGVRSIGSSLRAPHPMLCMDIALSKDASFGFPPDYPEQALYVASGEIELAWRPPSAGAVAGLPAGYAGSVQAISDARLMVLGGEPMDGRRHIWWNFVSSSKDRIEQAKDDWKLGRFPAVPGETDFIPLPA